MNKSKAEQAYFELAQISMSLPMTLGHRPSKLTWRVLPDGLVVGYTNRKKEHEFGTGPHAERVAMAWAEGLSDLAAERFAANYPELNYRGKQTNILK